VFFFKKKTELKDLPFSPAKKVKSRDESGAQTFRLFHKKIETE
jgi:hypothetical protein